MWISVDRYLAVRKPLRYETVQTRTRIDYKSHADLLIKITFHFRMSMLDVFHLDLGCNALLSLAVDGTRSKFWQIRLHLRSKLESHGRLFSHIRWVRWKNIKNRKYSALKNSCVSHIKDIFIRRDSHFSQQTVGNFWKVAVRNFQHWSEISEFCQKFWDIPFLHFNIWFFWDFSSQFSFPGKKPNFS